MEHRRGDRIAVDLPIGIKNPITSRSLVARLLNISADGALISGSFDSYVGSRVQICIDAPPHTAVSSSLIAAYLVRKAAGAFAIQWAEYAPTEVLAFLREHSVQNSTAQQVDQAQHALPNAATDKPR